MLAGREEREAGMRWRGSVETEWREMMKPARGASSRQIVPRALQMVLLGEASAGKKVVAIGVNGAAAEAAEAMGK
jgi:hypothetical protein